MATNGVTFLVFTVDLTQEKTVSGIYTVHWGSAFAPSQIEMLASDNGSDWTSVVIAETSGYRQIVKFDSPVKTRFLKYRMIKVPRRVDIAVFYVYAWE